ncbi:MAG: ATP-binding protein, partial [Gaiellaceae bacterium]
MPRGEIGVCRLRTRAAPVPQPAGAGGGAPVCTQRVGTGGLPEARREGARRCCARDVVPFRATVSDTGEGIPPDSLERIFDPFWRGDAARATAGSGLGLA